MKPDTPTKTELHQRIENLEREVAAQRQAANEHRNAAMEADLRTQAAVRSEKQALAENETLKLANETNNRLLDERTAQLNRLDATAAHWLQKAHEYQTENTALRALLETPNDLGNRLAATGRREGEDD